MIFKKGNGIKCVQDHYAFWYDEVPEDVDFEIKNNSALGSHIISLVGYGYGQIAKGIDTKSYGNGALYPYCMSEEQKKLLLSLAVIRATI